MKPKKIYAVKVGRKTGLFEDWESCKKQVDSFSGAVYKSFKTKTEALKFLEIDNFEEENRVIATKDEDIMNDLQQDEMIAYVDGSYNVKEKKIGYGGVLFTKNKKEEFFFSSEERKYLEHRNVSGEVLACMYSIKKALSLNLKQITIYYDYMGIKMWAIGAWKRNTALTKNYREFFLMIEDKIKVKFIKVQSHSGDVLNDRADELAKKGAGLI